MCIFQIPYGTGCITQAIFSLLLPFGILLLNTFSPDILLFGDSLSHEVNCFAVSIFFIPSNPTSLINAKEAYKFIKTRLDVEDWSGKTALSVLQDFFAKTLLITLCNIMCFKVKPKVKTNRKKIAKRPVIINRTYAMHQLKKSLFDWCTHGTDDKQIEAFRSEVEMQTRVFKKGLIVSKK